MGHRRAVCVSLLGGLALLGISGCGPQVPEVLVSVINIPDATKSLTTLLTLGGQTARDAPVLPLPPARKNYSFVLSFPTGSSGSVVLAVAAAGGADGTGKLLSANSAPEFALSVAQADIDLASRPDHDCDVQHPCIVAALSQIKSMSLTTKDFSLDLQGWRFDSGAMVQVDQAPVSCKWHSPSHLTCPDVALQVTQSSVEIEVKNPDMSADKVTHLF